MLFFSKVACITCWHAACMAWAAWWSTGALKVCLCYHVWLKPGVQPAACSKMLVNWHQADRRDRWSMDLPGVTDTMKFAWCVRQYSIFTWQRRACHTMHWALRRSLLCWCYSQFLPKQEEWSTRTVTEHTCTLQIAVQIFGHETALQHSSVKVLLRYMGI